MKPSRCPFCQNPNASAVQSKTTRIWRVHCDVCGAWGPIAPNAKTARIHWNDRDYSSLEELLIETLKQLKRVRTVRIHLR